jgi:pimeloyl-ACP methyl ester carboxylesterase
MAWFHVVSISFVFFGIFLHFSLNYLLTNDKLLDLPISSLDPVLQSWEQRGKYHDIFGYQIFGIQKNVMDANTTYVIIHGYPSSSFEYSYEAVDTFLKNGFNFALHDHLGFGFSDKPRSDFGYSVQDHADITLEYWHKINLSGDCVLVSHDMGDSVLTEILTRYSRNPMILPPYMKLKHVIFTNGGMSLKHYSPKLTQLLLVSSTTGEIFNRLMHAIDPTGKIIKQQLGTVFSKSSKGLYREHQLEMMEELLRYKHGDRLLWKTIRYINDRYACEERWLQGIKTVAMVMKTPISFLWGRDDPISPPAIPFYVIEKANLTNAPVKIMQNKGHFLMMEDGDGAVWAEMIINLTQRSSGSGNGRGMEEI